MMSWKEFGSDHDPTEVLPQNLAIDTEENQEKL
jgi:hypothetical protein